MVKIYNQALQKLHFTQAIKGHSFRAMVSARFSHNLSKTLWLVSFARKELKQKINTVRGKLVNQHSWQFNKHKLKINKSRQIPSNSHQCLFIVVSKTGAQKNPIILQACSSFRQKRLEQALQILLFSTTPVNQFKKPHHQIHTQIQYLCFRSKLHQSVCL